MTWQDLQNIYDWALIEKAVQAFFIAVPQSPFVMPDPKWQEGNDDHIDLDGKIAFFTAFEEKKFQKVRPRVSIALININEFPGMEVLDANGTLRADSWTARLNFTIATKTDYDYHRTVRAGVNAIIPMCQPNLNPGGTLIQTTGLNSILQFHEVGTLKIQNEDTKVQAQAGYYRSDISTNLTFSARVNAWPGGLQTN
jgi:hypothetical protein